MANTHTRCAKSIGYNNLCNTTKSHTRVLGHIPIRG
ncbi:hypothetical protein F383_18633 [Gossypium arboreum]|uniref:Uncharacterized protein n=1 Tax=Gossypium arboreum TaxID=29729 RepID=A0A0B0NLX5_GOSAR|nr:hypothetical protein F383_18633 [Gossypium arboreum]